MKKYIIDTNALISFVTDRNLDQQGEIDRLFKNAARLKILVLCPQNVLTEFVYVMDKVYQIPKPEINEMVQDFIYMPGIKVDELVKSRKTPFFVIPAKAGIQFFQLVAEFLDSGFHRSDDFLRNHQSCS